MSKIKISTTINKDLLKDAKIRAIQEGLNLNDIIEKGLKLYLEQPNKKG